MVLRTTILTLSLLVLMTGCGDEKTSPAAPAPPSSTASPAAPPATGAATAPTGAASGASGLPEDLPHWPGAEVVASGGDAAEGMIVSLRARNATPDDVFAHHREGLLANGWTLEGEIKSEDGSMLVAAKGPRRATLMFAPDEGSVEISVTVTSATE